MHKMILDSLREGRRQFNIRHKIVIYGTLNSGARFEMILDVIYDPVNEEVEQAIIRCFRSNAQSFNELRIEQGWRIAQWTYTSKGISLIGEK
jgi:hypothetical protein